MDVLNSYLPMIVVVLPLLVCLLLLPISNLLSRKSLQSIVVLLSVVVFYLYFMLYQHFSYLSFWTQVSGGDYIWHQQTASIPSLSLLFSFQASTLFLSAAIFVGGTAFLLFGFQMWGGDCSGNKSPMSHVQWVTAFMLLYMLLLLNAVASFSYSLLLLSLISLLSFVFLLSAQENSKNSGKLIPLFIAHRVSDLCLFIMLVLIVQASGDVSVTNVSLAFETIFSADGFERLSYGFFKDFSIYQLRVYIVVLAFLALISRFMFFPFQKLLLPTMKSSHLISIFFHLFTIILPILLLYSKICIVLHLSAVPHYYAVIFLAFNATILICAAVLSSKTGTFLLYFTYAFASFILYVFMSGELYGAWLLTALLALVFRAIVLSISRAVQSTHGMVVFTDLGGLWKMLRKSELMLSLTGFALFLGPGLFAFQRSIFAQKASPWRHSGGESFIYLFVFLAAVAFFRARFLIFTKEKKDKYGFTLVKMPLLNGVFLILLSFSILLFGFLFNLPKSLAAYLPIGYYNPVETFLLPSTHYFAKKLFLYAPSLDALDLGRNIELRTLAILFILVVSAIFVARFSFKKDDNNTLDQRKSYKKRLLVVFKWLQEYMESPSIWPQKIASIAVMPLLKISYALNLGFLPLFLKQPFIPLFKFPLWLIRIIGSIIQSGNAQRNIAWTFVFAALLFYFGQMSST